MAGELLIQVIDIGRIRAIRPVLEELDAARALGLETLAVAATSALVRGDRRRGFSGLLCRILNHPELEPRVFLAPAEVDGVIEGLVHVFYFENGAEASLISPIGPNRVVLDYLRRVHGPRLVPRDLSRTQSRGLPAGISACWLRGALWGPSREDVARVAAGLRPLLDDPIATEMTDRLKRLAKHFNLPVLALSQEVRAAAEVLARLAAKVLSREELTLAHMSLL